MKKLLCVVLFASAPALWAAQKSPQSPWSYSIRGEVELRYDDNILGLSDKEVSSLRATTDPENDDQWRIETPNDVIFSPLVGFGVYRKPPKGLDTGFGLSIGANQYVTNTIKDYHEYRLWARQELNHSREHRTTLSVGGSRTPSYFLRQLVDDDLATNTCDSIDPNSPLPNCHNSATFQLTTGYVEVSQEIINRILSAEVRYTREQRNYNHDFDERDADSDVYAVDVNVYPMRGIGLRLRPYYEHERRTTAGNPVSSSTIATDDAAFDGDMYGLEARGLWGKDADHRNTLRGFYQRESKDFASSDPNDTGHFGREDLIQKYGIGYGRELGKSLKLNISGYHRRNDVSTSNSAFVKNVVAVSLGYEFEK